MARSTSETPSARDRVLRTASDLFHREGSRAVGVDEIVTRAGVTKPSLYRAFASKDLLIAASLEGRRKLAATMLDEAVAAHPGDPRAQLLAYFDVLGQRALEPPYRGCALTNAAMEYPDPKHPARKAAVAHKEEVRERLRDLARAMGARKPKRLADSLLLLAEGVFASSHLFGAEGPAGAARGAAEALISAHAPQTP